MRFPRKLFIDFYRTGIHGDPFDAHYWKTPGPRSTSTWRVACKSHIRDANESLGVAGLDLGLPAEAIRDYFADGVRASYQVMTMPDGGADPRSSIRALFALGIAGDKAAARKLAAACVRVGVHPGDADDTNRGVADVLMAHALGGSRAAAVERLKGLRANKRVGANAVAVRESLRELTLHCATATVPEPTKLLRKLAAANAKIWRAHHAGFEAYLAQHGVAVACMARDRGWRMPEEDPHPSMPVALLRLAPIRIDLDDDRFSPPSAEIKRRVRAATKESLALLYPRKSLRRRS